MAPAHAKTLAGQAEVLLSLGNAVDNQIPSKLFEYFGAGKPILHLSVSDGDAALPYLKRYPLALVLRAADGATPEVVAGLRAWLHRSAGKSLSYAQAAAIFPEFTSKRWRGGSCRSRRGEPASANRPSARCRARPGKSKEVPMPKILWLVSITLPQAAAAVGLASDQVGGGWLAGMLDALAPQLRLTVASVDARAKTPLSGEKDGVRFAVLPAADCFDGLLAGETPDLVHIWGTEYAAAAAMQQAAARRGLPVLVGMQGVMSDCAAHLCDGVPQPYLHSDPLQRAIDRVVPGALLDKMQRQFDALAQSEAALLANARHVTGRTGFDRRAVAALAPMPATTPATRHCARLSGRRRAVGARGSSAVPRSS